MPPCGVHVSIMHAGIILAPFYHVLDIAVGDTAKKGAFWPGMYVTSMTG
jgi:hypothetical protein